MASSHIIFWAAIVVIAAVAGMALGIWLSRRALQETHNGVDRRQAIHSGYRHVPNETASGRRLEDQLDTPIEQCSGLSIPAIATSRLASADKPSTGL